MIKPDFEKNLKKYKKELVVVQVQDLKEYKHNNKKHTSESVDGIQQSMTDSGYVSPIVVNEDNMIIAGHGRLKALQRFNEKEVEVVKIYGIEKPAEMSNRIYDNITNSLSGYDKKSMLHEGQILLKEYGIDISDMVPFDLDLDFSEDDFDGEGEDDVPTDPGEMHVKVGDVFKLGEHTLMCGDSTSEKDLKTLMGPNKADMIFTDPPYNVNYVGSGKNTSRGIENDNMGASEFDQFLDDVFARYKENTHDHAGVYIFHSTSTQAQFEVSLIKNGFVIKNQLIWNKPSASMGWGDYRWKHEPFFYCGLKDQKTKFYGDRTHTTVAEGLEDLTDRQILKLIKRSKEMEAEGYTTVWTMKRDKVNEYIHPTQKPVGLIEKAIRNSTLQHDKVIDLFGGSGSTLVACEKTKRQCFSMELNPTFVQLILKRYKKVTSGKQAIKCLNNKKFDFTFLEK